LGGFRAFTTYHSAPIPGPSPIYGGRGKEFGSCLLPPLSGEGLRVGAGGLGDSVKKDFMSLGARKDRIYKKPNKPAYMISLARNMRKNPTESERLLWEALKEVNFFGFHFRRQAPVGRCIFDLYCAKKKLAFEIDGSSHNDKEEFDKNRDTDVAAASIKTIRFSDESVLNNINDVLLQIKNALFSSCLPLP
jgi:very-short-patch-repair endonuclease